MANWSLNYQVLKGVKPDLIMVSISAMGQSGPWKDFVAYAQTVHALSGLTYLTSLAPDDPLGLGFPYADHIVGLYAALAVLAALEHRDTTGEGQYIDLSAYEAACTLLGPTLLDLSLHGGDTLPQGNRPEYIPAAPYGCYPCLGRDRFCVIAVGNEEEWQALCRVMGNPAWAKEERFSHLSGRKKHAQELDEFLGRWTRQHPAEEVFQLLQDAGIAAGLVEDAADLLQDPQLEARKFFFLLEHPVLGKTSGDRTPIEFMDEPQARPLRAAPLLGEDNRYVFMELLGFAESEYSAYLQKGIIG
jgi:crotonobetainyl-CoA:carnitine CoA-transferase CaiB-like acyl-CoA transferase